MDLFNCIFKGHFKRFVRRCKPDGSGQCPVPLCEEHFFLACALGRLDFVKFMCSSFKNHPWHCSGEDPLREEEFDAETVVLFSHLFCTGDFFEFARHLQIRADRRGVERSCNGTKPWNGMACSLAAMFGHQDVVCFLRSGDEPCPASRKTCEFAASMGNLDVLKVLRSGPHPCPWDEDTHRAAAVGKHAEVLEWLLTGDDPCPVADLVCTCTHKYKNPFRTECPKCPSSSSTEGE